MRLRKMTTKKTLQIILIGMGISTVLHYFVALTTNEVVSGLVFIGCMMGTLFFYNQLQRPTYNY